MHSGSCHHGDAVCVQNNYMKKAREKSFLQSTHRVRSHLFNYNSFFVLDRKSSQKEGLGRWLKNKLFSSVPLAIKIAVEAKTFIFYPRQPKY